MENPTPKTEAPPTEKQQDGTSASTDSTESSETQTHEQPKSSASKADQVLDHEAELAKLESEFGKVGQEYSTGEIGDWEFDELERQLTSSHSATSH